MAAPLDDIGINPARSNRTLVVGCVAGGTGIKYGYVVKGKTSGNTNFRDVILASGKGDTGLRGVVCDQGDPNDSGKFASGEEFGVCTEGYAEVWLDAGESAVKDAPAISGTTDGTVAAVAGSAPYDIVGTFAQTYDNSLGATPVLISIKVGVYRRFS
jgi:hypothetical protein